MSVFDHLIYWNDVVPRKGSENMAVDQFLLERAQRYPILRVYQWSEPSISFGYFHKLEEVELTYPPNGGLLNYVRRWTGGGIVDHRLDLTYTLVVPRDFQARAEQLVDGLRAEIKIYECNGLTLVYMLQ